MVKSIGEPSTRLRSAESRKRQANVPSALAFAFASADDKADVDFDSTSQPDVVVEPVDPDWKLGARIAQIRQPVRRLKLQDVDIESLART